MNKEPKMNSRYTQNFGLNAVPLPFYHGLLWWPFKGRYGCCGKRGFWKYSSYEKHYRESHLSKESES